MDHWSRWLFQEHTEAELRGWARRLKVFRYVRSYGGHANDGDDLIAAFHYKSLEDLKAMLASVGISLYTYPDPPPQPEVGKSYRGDEFAAFPSLISGSLTEQPKWQSIDGQRVYVWCHDGIARFSISEPYEVNESCVQAAELVERALAELAAVRIEPPLDNKHCICPKYYPAYFS
jgi:hypothetical protein